VLETTCFVFKRSMASYCRSQLYSIEGSPLFGLCLPPGMLDVQMPVFNSVIFAALPDVSPASSQQTCRDRRITLSDLPAAIAAGKDTIADASSRMLSAERIGFELFTIHPSLKCKPYRYSWGTSLQVSSTTAWPSLTLQVSSTTARPSLTLQACTSTAYMDVVLLHALVARPCVHAHVTAPCVHAHATTPCVHARVTTPYEHTAPTVSECL